MSHKKLTISQCPTLVDAVTRKINHWACKSLSYATRLTLIKSVISGMQSYWSQLFLLPKKVTKKIHSLCRRFLWSEADEKHKAAPMAWSTICLLKHCGGLGVRNLEIWNLAIVLK